MDHNFTDGNKTALKSLDPIQNQCLRIATGMRQTTPIKTLLVESHIPTLKDRRAMLSMRYLSRILEKPSNSPILQTLMRYRSSLSKHPGYFEQCEEIMDEWKLTSPARSPCLPRSPIPPWSDLLETISTGFQINPKESSPTTIQQYFLQERNTKYVEYTAIYTDGSKSDRHTTAAYVIPKRNISYHITINKDSSILTAELLAIDKALEYCMENEMCKYIIYTDSKSALLLLTMHRQKTFRFITYSIQSKLLTLNKKVYLQWVPAHMGITGNEQADNLAKQISRNTSLMYSKLHKEDYYSMLKKRMYTNWQERYTQSFQTDNKGLIFHSIKERIKQWKWVSH